MEAEAGLVVDSLVGLAAVVLLVLLNGFFVAAEFSLVSVRRTRVEEMIAQGVREAEAVRKAIHDPDRFIAATQLGITLASLGLGWIGEPALSHLIDPVIALIPLPDTWANVTSHSVSAVLAFAAITFLHVVVGELAPKSIALQRTEQTALVVARPTLWSEWIFRPGIVLLNGAGNWILKRLGFEPAAGHELVHSVEELKLIVEASADQGMLDGSQQDMLRAVFDLREVLVRQLMIPRTEMAMLAVGARLRDVLAIHKEHPHGKVPVYEGDQDHVVGILYVRDIVEELAEGNLSAPVRPFLRKVIFLPETARISAALTAFRAERQHIAIVLDEYGGTAGLITLEDVLEEIAGEMPDQYDTDGPEIAKRPDGSWVVSGLALIEDVNDTLGLSLSDENYDTIGGYVMGKLERIPQKGDEVSARAAHFKVEQVDGMRIDRLVVFVDR
jgi:CBS domain containing-hemolysin-like protein